MLVAEVKLCSERVVNHNIEMSPPIKCVNLFQKVKGEREGGGERERGMLCQSCLKLFDSVSV